MSQYVPIPRTPARFLRPAMVAVQRSRSSARNLSSARAGVAPCDPPHCGSVVSRCGIEQSACGVGVPDSTSCRHRTHRPILLPPDARRGRARGARREASGTRRSCFARGHAVYARMVAAMATATPASTDPAWPAAAETGSTLTQFSAVRTLVDLEPPHSRTRCDLRYWVIAPEMGSLHSASVKNCTWIFSAPICAQAGSGERPARPAGAAQASLSPGNSP